MLVEFIVLGGSSPVTMGVAAAEPHVVCLDGTRLELYHDGVYRFFERPRTLRENSENTQDAHDVVAVAVPESVPDGTDGSDASIVVNIGVRNTFVSTATVFASGKIVAWVDYLVYHDNDLHAQRLLVSTWRDDQSQGDGQGQGDSDGRTLKKEEVDAWEVRLEGGHTVRFEAQYRAVAVAGPWQKGHRVVLGGALGGVVHEAASLRDVTQGPLREVVIGEWDAHALLCDAHFPHAVTFHGAQRIPGHGQHVLLRGGGVLVRADLDDYSRLKRLRVDPTTPTTPTTATTPTNVDPKPNMQAIWSRYEGDLPPATDHAPITALCLGPVQSTLRTHGVSAKEASRAIDRVFPLSFKTTNRIQGKGEGDNMNDDGGYDDDDDGDDDDGGDANQADGELLVRVQANGAASFAVRGKPGFTQTFLSTATGLLTQGADDASAHRLASGACGSHTPVLSTSVYERVVEPHLAWSQGRSTSVPATEATCGVFYAA